MCSSVCISPSSKRFLNMYLTDLEALIAVYCPNTRSPKEWKYFSEPFENGYDSNPLKKGYKCFLEGWLNDLINDIENKKVIVKLTLDEGIRFFKAMDFELISQKTRDVLCSLVYPIFVKDILQKEEPIRHLTLKEVMILQRIIYCDFVDEDLRMKLRNFVYPGFIANLIDDIRKDRYILNYISYEEYLGLNVIIESNVNPELCVCLKSLIYS